VYEQTMLDNFKAYHILAQALKYREMVKSVVNMLLCFRDAKIQFFLYMQNYSLPGVPEF